MDSVVHVASACPGLESLDLVELGYNAHSQCTSAACRTKYSVGAASDISCIVESYHLEFGSNLASADTSLNRRHCCAGILAKPCCDMPGTPWVHQDSTLFLALHALPFLSGLFQELALAGSPALLLKYIRQVLKEVQASS